MDFLLRMEELKFFVDEISPLHNEMNIFAVKVIPDINSENVSPVHFHVRYINVTSDLLEANFYRTTVEKDIRKGKFIDQDFLGSVIQGGYYNINTKKLGRF